MGRTCVNNTDGAPCVQQHAHGVPVSNRYYLRSVGKDPRKHPSDLAAAFPHLAADMALPDALLPPGSVFSTVLRIGSGALCAMLSCTFHYITNHMPTGGLQLWPHYDVVDNLLMQIRGTKRVIMWPPSEEGNLYTQV